MSIAFRYRALDEHGGLCTGYALAGSAATLAQKLAARQLILLSCKKTKHLRSTAVRREIPAALSLQIGQCLRAGLPLADALESIASDEASPELAMICRELWLSLQCGHSFSHSLAAWPAYFSATFVALVCAGEASGRLDRVLDQIADHLKRAEDLRQQTRHLLIRPLLSGAAVLTALLTLLAFLVPKIRGFLEESAQALPWHTRALFALSDALLAYWPALLLMIALLPLLRLAWRHPRTRERCAALTPRLPLFGPILRELSLARLAGVMALLYRSGIPLIDALRLAGGTLEHPGYQQSTRRMAHQLEQGKSLSTVFREAPGFPPFFLRMVEIGEHTGNLDEAMSTLAERHEQLARHGIARIQALLEPSLTLGAGLILGWIMLATLQPIYALVGGGLP